MVYNCIVYSHIFTEIILFPEVSLLIFPQYSPHVTRAAFSWSFLKSTGDNTDKIKMYILQGLTLPPATLDHVVPGDAAVSARALVVHETFSTIGSSDVTNTVHVIC